jgi:hypothetical protein
MGRQSDFETEVLPEGFPPCHLYLVTIKPRLSIDPSSVRIDADYITCTLRIQHQDTFDEVPIRASNGLGSDDLTWESEWPFETFRIVDSAGSIVSEGVVAHLHKWIDRWPRVAQEHEVVYVGQAFGKTGDRTAWDRLQRHETLQKVLSDTPRDKQVWLTLAYISDLNLLMDIDGRVRPDMTDVDDNAHVVDVVKALDAGGFKEREAVALAEAGLIRYFQPKYNNQMKYTFPAPGHVSLESVRSLDLHGLAVELQGGELRVLYGSPTRPHSQWHCPGFSIHEDENRAMTVTLTATTFVPPSR